MSWSRAFEDPITLPDGRTLSTLREAGQKFSVVFTIKCRPGISHHGLENELRALVAQAQKRRILPAAIRTFAPRFVVKLFEIETDKRPFAGFVPNPDFDWQMNRSSFAPETTCQNATNTLDL
jgi:hypothetical protein